MKDAMRWGTASRLVMGAAVLGLLAGCSSAGTDETTPAKSPSPTPEAAGWPVYDRPAAPDLVVRKVPLARDVGRGFDNVSRVERIGGVAVISGRNDDLDELVKAVDLRSGRVLWQRRTGESVESRFGDVELDAWTAVVPSSGVLLHTSYVPGCEDNAAACGIDPRLEERGQALHAVDARTGAVRWSVPVLPKDGDANLGRLPFGVPEVKAAGSVVAVNLIDDDGEQALVQGYDAATGKRLWERRGAWATGGTEGTLLAEVVADTSAEPGEGPVQARDPRTGKVRWTNPDLPGDVAPVASGSPDAGMGQAMDTFFSLADGHEIARSTAFAVLATGTDGSYGVSVGPYLDESQCCVKAIATVGPDGSWRRSEYAVGQSVEAVDGDYTWRSLDRRGDGLVAVDRTGEARSRELPISYGAEFAPGLILGDDSLRGISMWTYRARNR